MNWLQRITGRFRRSLPGESAATIARKQLLEKATHSMQVQNTYRDIIARVQYLVLAASKQVMLDPAGEEVVVSVRVHRPEPGKIEIDVETTDNFEEDPRTLQ